MVLNWVKFIVVFLVSLTSVITIIVLYSADKPVSNAKEKAIEAVIQSGQLVSVNTAQPYNGKVSSVTVFGLDEKGVAKAVFVDENQKSDFKEVKLKNGIKADEAVTIVKQEIAVHDLLHVTLGMEEDGPVWEVAFNNEKGKLNYVYVLFEGGQWWKRILNL
ncbi:DUF5590 domain-containing protein [Filibacter tadaridae]|uniref:Cell wall elongation regulator TseB-like domain-containing protein n=1 Tax=Filibacter tadaridae TaxID=2483811 RepID=A0A3P5XE80_9BACL|nr:DUF5590 domain-containing protein [Filibacter tadaridae]VDC29144.1 hypothetical protein FILTAD_01996 [Filibacter tadaridae]